MEHVIDLARRRAAALSQRDWDAVAAQLHARFVYVNANGVRLDRSGYLSFLAEGPVRWRAQTLRDIEVAGAGGVAALTATVVDEVAVDGAAARWEFVTTQTYVDEGGAWLYLAGHTAVPAGA
jgi:hypothetical protein